MPAPPLLGGGDRGVVGRVGYYYDLLAEVGDVVVIKACIILVMSVWFIWAVTWTVVLIVELVVEMRRMS